MKNQASPLASGERKTENAGDSVLALRVSDVANGILVSNGYDRKLLKGIPNKILNLEMRESALWDIARLIDEELRFPLGVALVSRLGRSKNKRKSVSGMQRLKVMHRRKDFPKGCGKIWDRMMFLFSLSARILHM